MIIRKVNQCQLCDVLTKRVILPTQIFESFLAHSSHTIKYQLYTIITKFGIYNRINFQRCGIDSRIHAEFTVH